MSSLILAGDTSGAITLTVPATAGTNTITLPASTGTAITTASTSGIPNTINWTTVQTSSVSPAVAGTGYPMNTTSSALTVTLPASPSAGQIISILDYAGTAATNNITINPNGNKIQGTTTNRLINTNREAINLVYVDSTQGWLAYADVYSTTNPIPLVPYTASYLLVAGGGGGGGAGGGGAGAGGFLTGTISLSVGTVYTAVVGGGGAGGTFSYDNPANRGSTGSDSTFPGVTTASGGGGGGGGQQFSVPASGAGRSGGSGGGTGGAGSANVAGASGTPGQGNNGGANSPAGPNYGAGGGGGAGAVGVAGSGSGSGAGGAGTASSITGTPATLGGGGGGGGYTGPGGGNIGGAGGAGGGGAGTGPGAATSGTVNTGGGGGASSTAYAATGAGGSGVVILSVPTANYSGTTTGSPTITTSGANTIIKYTSGSGTYTA
jgi:hypothetical protein